MWVEFYCGNCGKRLDYYNESHDSIEFMIDKDNLNCSNCEGYLIEIRCRRG